jgi:hypothetical protein
MDFEEADIRLMRDDVAVMLRLQAETGAGR